MADHRLLIPWTGVVILGFVALPLAGQSADEYLERLQRLSAAWESALLLADSADLEIAARTEMDTVVIGRLVTLNAGGASPAVRRGMGLAWETLSAALMSDTTFLDELVFVVPRLGMRIGIVEYETRTVRAIRVQTNQASVYARRIRDGVSEALTALIDTAFATWLGRTISVDPAPPNYSLIKAEFDAPASFLVQDCADGSATACRTALGIDTVIDPVFDWYDADGRAALVAGWPGLAGRDFEARDVCTERGWDQVCVAILQSGRLPFPLSNSARASFLRFVIQRGGDGAYGRLTKGSAGHSIGNILETTGGTELDGLIGEWVDHVLTAKVETPRFPARSGATSLLWVAAILGLAMRNRSWR